MNGATRPRPGQIATGLGLTAICLAFSYAGGLLAPSDWYDPAQSKTLFPALMLIGAAVAGVFIAFGGSKGSPKPALPGGHWRSIGIWILAAAYAIALPRAGLLVSTTVLCVALPLLLGYRYWLGIIAFSVTIVALTWLVFIRLMDVPLPL